MTDDQPDDYQLVDDVILDRFRSWLHQARAEADALVPSSEGGPGPLNCAGQGPGEGETPKVGLYRLVEEFTALRHEIKLQTKGTRGLQEQAEALLTGLRQAIDQFRSVEPREAQAAWSAGRSLAETLAGLDEALDRGRAELEKVRRRLVDHRPEPASAILTALDELYSQQPWFRRLEFRPYHEQTRELIRQSLPAAEPPGLVKSLLEGYDLLRDRLSRALKSERIERIDCVGQPVDPEWMIAVEVVDAPNLPPGQVVEEVRRGYTWQGRLLRLAEVRATRFASTSTSTSPHPEPVWEDD